MDEIIIREIVKRNIVIIVMFLFSAAIVIFTVTGVYDAFWNVPAKNTEIQRLTNLCNAKQDRIVELDKYIIDREKKYQVATKCGNLFMLIADPNQIMDFEDLEKQIQDKKDFFKPINLKKKK